VGKSSIVVRYADDEFSEVFLATIGVDFRFKSFPLEGNKIKLQIWDTAGHERFRTITSSYYRGAHALMIVFDILDKQSFEDAVNYWYGEIRNSCPPETQILLVGNKNDMADKRVVSTETVQEFLDKHKEIQYIETSAKTAEHIEEAFHKIAGMLVEAQVKASQLKDPKIKKKDRKTGTEATAEE
jgi:Ras-related protein Rab-1A